MFKNILLVLVMFSDVYFFKKSSWWNKKKKESKDKEEFKSFKNKYHKNYGSPEEENYRIKIFKENKKNIAKW